MRSQILEIAPDLKEQQALDLEWLSERCNGDSILMFEVLHLFSDQSRTHLESMRSNWAQKNSKDAAFHAEFLIGAAANIGASDLRRKAENLYHALLHEMEDDQPCKISNLLNSVATSFRSCLNSISSISSYVKPTLDMTQQLSSSKSFRVPETKAPSIEIRRPSRRSRRGSMDSAFLDPHRADRCTNRAGSEPPSQDGSAFPLMRGHLDVIRQHNQAGRGPAARAEAFALYFTASGAGCLGLAAAAARAGMGGRYIAKQAMDELEARLDTEAALWELKRGS
jgi:HPt (histidine-containing phosphotransfer) domain-containing protein